MGPESGTGESRSKKDFFPLNILIDISLLSLYNSNLIYN
jgi:hypothetical protein